MPLDETSWKTLIDSSCKGTYNGQPLDIKHLTPILCYQYALQKKAPNTSLEETSEVDHIIPKAKLDNNSMIPIGYRDALFNLELLPKGDNIQKKDKTLQEVNDTFLQKNISRYTDIKIEDFQKYSDVSHIEELKEERQALLSKVFGEIRKTELAN